MAKTRRAKFTERLEVEDGQLVRFVTANWRHLHFDAIREYEDGREQCRNLYTGFYGGYYVQFPQELDGAHERWYDEWGDCKTHVSTRKINEQEKQLITAHYPAFRYVLAKWDNGDLHETLLALRIWKEHPEIEMLLAAGLEQIAFSKNLYKLTPQKKKSVIAFIRRHCKEIGNYSLHDIFACMKHNISIQEYDEYKDFCTASSWVGGNGRITFDEFRYFKKQGISTSGIGTYRDYIQMAKEAGHDIKSPYWRFPSDIEAAHEKVMREVDNIHAMRRLAEQREKKRREQEKLQNYQKRIEKYLCYNGTVDGFSIYIPNEPHDWETQAAELHQCICAADYLGKVADGKCLIVFIRQGSTPIATAEIKPGKKLGQFYGNELDRSNCLPPPQAAAAFHTWLTGVKMGAAI